MARFTNFPAGRPARGPKVFICYRHLVGGLEHWHFDSFRVKWRETVVYPFPRGRVTFTLDPQAKVSEMKIDVPNPDFDFRELEFKRAPDAPGRD